MIKSTLTMMALAALLAIGICSALPPAPDASYPYPYSDIPAPDGYSPDIDWSGYPAGDYPAGGYPIGDYPTDDYPAGVPPTSDVPSPGPIPSGDDFSDFTDPGSGHPASGPSISQPASAPTADSVQPLTYLSDGESLSAQEAASAGGLQAVSELTSSGPGLSPSPGPGYGSGSYSHSSIDGTQTKAVALIFGPGIPSVPTGPQLWTRYHGHWTSGPASIFLGGWTNMLVRNDHRQRVWSWERYPDGSQRWSYWGLRNPGYFSGQFVGDTRGWHYLAMWGTRTGWSNVVPIFVWW